MSNAALAADRSEARTASERPEPMNTRHGKKQDRKFGTIIAPYLFVLPAFVIVFVFIVLAALNTFRLAFTDSTLLRPGKFVGFENFIKLFHDEYFLTALLNPTIYVICVVPFMVILPLILAYLVKGNSRIIPFLTDRWGVLFSSMFVTIWLGLGYYMVIYLTALANIDESLYEAASLDGAGPVRQFIYVTMPGVRSTMMLIMMLSTIAAFRVFNEIYVLTNGSAGPGGMDMTMSMLIKREGTGIQARTGYASAISIVVLVIVGVMLIVQQIVQKRGED